MTNGTRRRLDRLARHAAEARHSAAATAPGGQCHDDPAHVAQVIAGMVECGAWTLDDVAERAGLSAADLREMLDGGPPAAGEW